MSGAGIPAADLDEPEPPRPRKQRPPILRRENLRAILGALLGALVAVFAVLNLDEVQVDWILASGETPLIVVIAVSFLAGALTMFVVRAARRRR